jgi:hypothetical protein
LPVVYDHTVTAARRIVARHRAIRVKPVTICAAGCGHWPCKPFSTAFGVITHNSNTLSSR